MDHCLSNATVQVDMQTKNGCLETLLSGQAMLCQDECACCLSVKTWAADSSR